MTAGLTSAMTSTVIFRADPRVIALGLAIDLVLGDPPNAFHPVAWLGRGTRLLLRAAPAEGRARQLVAGALVVAIATGASALAGAGVAALAHTPGLSHGLGVIVAALALKSTFAIRGLGAASRNVALALAAGDLGGARTALASLCSRNPSALDGTAVAAAAIESVAENTSDSVVAPLFFYLLLGLPGAAFYRAANTLDAMIGYHGPTEFLGKAAARLDDALNWIPARLTAGLLIVAGFLRRADARGGARVWRRDGALTESPNAGRPMAAMAGLLGVVLDKPGHYRLGAGGAPADVARLGAAWRIARDAALLAFALAFVLALCLCARPGRP